MSYDYDNEVDSLEDDLESQRYVFEERFFDDFPDASEAQVEAAWQVELVEMGEVRAPADVAHAGGPKPNLVDDSSNHVVMTAPQDVEAMRKAGAGAGSRGGRGSRPSGSKGWNAKLREDGLGVDDAYPGGLSDAELERRLDLTPEGRAWEARWLSDNVGPGVTVVVAPARMGGTGRKPNTHGATRVLRADGSSAYMRVGNDQGAIEEWLTRDQIAVEDFAPAIARGRRSGRANEMRELLRGRVSELLNMGATQCSVAAVLGCSDKTVRALAK